MIMCADNPSDGEIKISKSEFRERLIQLPPSSKLVIKIIEDDGPQSFSELRKKSLLPERTLENSIKKLKRYELIHVVDNLQTTNQKIYIIDIV